MSTKKLQITIDGPVAAGKSTVAKKLAEKLGLLYIDTGAMYRVVALATERAGVAWGDEDTVSQMMPKIKIRLAKPVGKKNDGRTATVYMGSEDVSWKIRNAHIGEGASVVSQYPEVRKTLVRLQRKISNHKDVVMEGRDIGTRVLTSAPLKIYMFADLQERVMRKKKQLTAAGSKLTKKSIEKNITTRDNREMTRKVDPLRPARGAWKFDTTKLEIDEVVEAIIRRVIKLGLRDL